MNDLLFKVNWQEVFVPSLSLTELFIRGTFVYLLLFALLRFLPSRQVGAVGVSDLLLVILFANAAQNAMASDYIAVTDGLVLVGTIIFWNYVLNWLSYKVPAIQRMFTPPPLMLVKQGRMIPRNMRKELITEGELMIQLRKQGVEKLDEVRMAFMEADGNISIITQDAKPRTSPKKKRIG